MSKFWNAEDRNEYYKSERWGEIKQNLFSIRGKQCEICGSKRNIHLHHVSYERFGGEEILEDLQVLCSKHHKEIHGIEHKEPKTTKGKIRKVIRDTFYNIQAI